MAWVCMALSLILFAMAFRADNPNDAAAINQTS